MEIKFNVEQRRAYDLFKLKEEEEVIKDDKIVVPKRRYINGYVIIFNELSNPIQELFINDSFREQILPEAIDRNLINSSDILMLVNHDRSNGLLARSKNGIGSLRIEIDDKGVFFEFELPNTQLGNDIYELIQRGDINQCSFSFSIPEGGDEISDEGGEVIRTIKKIDRIYDFSIVDFPAYDETSVEVAERSIQQFKSKKSDLERRAAAEAVKAAIRARAVKNSFKIKYNLN